MREDGSMSELIDLDSPPARPAVRGAAWVPGGVAAVTPIELARSTPWTLDAWQQAHDLIVTDGRLDWDTVAQWAIDASAGPGIADALISALNAYQS